MGKMPLSFMDVKVWMKNGQFNLKDGKLDDFSALYTALNQLPSYNLAKLDCRASNNETTKQPHLPVIFEEYLLICQSVHRGNSVTLFQQNNDTRIS